MREREREREREPARERKKNIGAELKNKKKIV